MVEHTTLSDEPKPLHVGPLGAGHTARRQFDEEHGTGPQIRARPLNRIGGLVAGEGLTLTSFLMGVWGK